MPIELTPGESGQSPAPLRILHLEDDADDAAIIAWTLRTAGIQCRVIRVEDERNYATALHQGEIDLILSDCNVGGFSGLTALDMARTANAQIPFVFLTGSATPEMKALALERGAWDCLNKEHRVQLVFLAQRVWQNKSQE